MSGDRAANRPALFVCRRRRTFGLDEARRPAPDRTEREVLAWLAAHLPAAMPFQPREGLAAEPQAGRALALLLPGGRAAMLWLAGRRDDSGLATLAEACRSRAVPLAVVRSVEEARAALRRFGFEPERP